MYDSHQDPKYCHAVLASRVPIGVLEHIIHDDVCNPPREKHKHGKYEKDRLVALIFIIKLHKAYNRCNADYACHSRRNIYHLLHAADPQPLQQNLDGRIANDCPEQHEKAAWEKLIQVPFQIQH